MLEAAEDNIPHNNIVGNNIFLIPEEVMLKTWQKLVLNEQIFCLQGILEPGSTFTCYQTELKHPCTEILLQYSAQCCQKYHCSCKSL